MYRKISVDPVTFREYNILQAGQATEPEVLIALTLAAGGDNQVLFSLSNL
jgi:hypothetical protein